MPFQVTQFSEDNIHISVYDVDIITPELRQFIDQNIYQICMGEPGDLSTIKLDLKGRIERWKDLNKKIGSIAEFFVHLYLKYSGYNQECLFFNLEEKSLKKGFDGVYSMEDELWFMESKSGLITTKGITHSSKIREAYSDLKDKITANTSNNPWANAYNHARTVGTKKNLRETLKTLSNDFVNNRYQQIDDKNIIPCATIFFNGIWHKQNHEEIIESIKSISTLQGKNIHIICITQKSYEMFMQYLGS